MFPYSYPSQIEAICQNLVSDSQRERNILGLAEVTWVAYPSLRVENEGTKKRAEEFPSDEVAHELRNEVSSADLMPTSRISLLKEV